MKMRGWFGGLLLMVTAACGAQTWTETLYPSVTGTNAAPIQASDGNIYALGNAEYPTEPGINKLTPDGTSSLFFEPAEGQNIGPFVQGTDGNFYGVASGGANSQGTIFRLTLGGSYSVVGSFPSTFGATYTPSPVIQGTDGNFYGIATMTNVEPSVGAVYRVTPSGNFSLLYIGLNTAGIGSGLVQGTDGNFYGFGCGVFRVTPLGSYTQVSPCVSNGIPGGPMVFGADGALYGAYNVADSQVQGYYQTDVIRIPPSTGKVSLLTIYPGQVGPPLLVASDGNFYAAGSEVYQITPGGAEKKIYTFGTNNGDGTFASSSLLQANNGSLYGGSYISADEGQYNQGPLYSLAATPALGGAVQVSVYPASVAVGQSAELVWNATNAFSATMRQCFATGPSFSGIKNFSGSTTVSQNTAGTYTYAVTCGGVETGLATLTVGTGAASAATVAATPNPVNEGQTLMLTAAVAPKSGSGSTPTGTVQFLLGTRLLGTAGLSSGDAALSVSTAGVAPGTYSVTAVYGGDSTYAGVTSTPVTLTIAEGQATTTTSLTINPAAPYVGGPVTVTATVTPSYGAAPTGSMTMRGAGELIGTFPLVNGVAHASFTVPNLAPGNYFLTASYAGDASDAASSSGNVPVVLSTQTAVTMTASPNPIVQGNTILLTATLSNNASGTVEFRVGSDVVGTVLAGNGAGSTTFSTQGAPLGTYTVRAYYLGGGTNLPGTSPGVSVSVIPQGSVIRGGSDRLR